MTAHPTTPEKRRYYWRQARLLNTRWTVIALHEVGDTGTLWLAASPVIPGRVADAMTGHDLTANGDKLLGSHRAAMDYADRMARAPAPRPYDDRSDTP